MAFEEVSLGKGNTQEGGELHSNPTVQPESSPGENTMEVSRTPEPSGSAKIILAPDTGKVEDKILVLGLRPASPPHSPPQSRQMNSLEFFASSDTDNHPRHENSLPA